MLGKLNAIRISGTGTKYGLFVGCWGISLSLSLSPEAANFWLISLLDRISFGGLTSRMPWIKTKFAMPKARYCTLRAVKPKHSVASYPDRAP